ncbi:MAG: DMT family transporter [Bacteroidales bacterium]|nr:DMT family transporter [Bacteroidales bacterium]
MKRLIDLRKKHWQWIVFIGLAFIWGTSFILMKKGLQSYTHMQVAAFRVFFSFLLFLPFIFKYIKKFSLSNLKSLLVVGIIGIAIPALLFTKAQTHVDSSVAGMLNSLTPLFTFIISLLFYKTYAKLINILGVFLALVGAVGLMLKRGSFSFYDIDSYTLFIVLATFCYGINVNEIKHKLKHLTSMEISALAFVVTGPIAGIYLLFSDYSYTSANPNPIQNLIFIFILALFSSVIATIVFNQLIKFTTTLFAASITYIIPIFAIFWGVFDGESINPLQYIWIALILFGVYLVNKTKNIKNEDEKV